LEEAGVVGFRIGGQETLGEVQIEQHFWWLPEEKIHVTVSLAQNSIVFQLGEITLLPT
jgi:hypothetical protein